MVYVGYDEGSNFSDGSFYGTGDFGSAVHVHMETLTYRYCTYSLDFRL